VSSKIVINSSKNLKGPIDANGKAVLVSGTQCIVELTGKCPSLKVLGRGNKVKADEVVELSIAGLDSEVVVGTLGEATVSGCTNQLTWSRSANGVDPKVALHGIGNQSRKR
jgi:Protein of unknown function (DUF3060)